MTWLVTAVAQFFVLRPSHTIVSNRQSEVLKLLGYHVQVLIEGALHFSLKIPDINQNIIQCLCAPEKPGVILLGIEVNFIFIAVQLLRTEILQVLGIVDVTYNSILTVPKSVSSFDEKEICHAIFDGIGFAQSIVLLYAVEAWFLVQTTLPNP